MFSGAIRRASSARAACWGRPVYNLLAVAAVALGCAACNATGSNGSLATLAAASGDTPVIAFESIDGPPESIHGKLVRSLSEEASAHQVAVVSRGTPANYRIRVYAATDANRKRAVLHWVWDVYNAKNQRAFRLSGEESMAGAGRTNWASADDQVIRKVARAGMDRLVSHLRSPAPETAPPPAPGPAIALAAEN